MAKGNNEQIISALIQHGTVAEAAKAAGVSPRTIYDRMQDREFIADYKRAKSDIIRSAVFSINGKLSDAISTIADMMQDKDIPPAIRLQAAQTILNNAEKFTNRLDREEHQANIIQNPLNDMFL